jgi:hypothetical protein
MKRSITVLSSLLLWMVNAEAAPARKTTVSIVGDQFFINGKPTYEGRSWRGHKVEGLLLNSRMVQGIFDDRNPQTVRRWAYPDTGKWDAERNTREFLDAMDDWRRHGLLAFTISLQGGSPEGYSQNQPWHNSAIEADGSLRADYLNRLERILDKADRLGMAVILGYFYFGQDQRLRDEAAVIRATDNATQWLFERDYRNVLIEINNECNVRYDHDILKPERVHELILRVRNTTKGARRFYVGTSYGGGTIPKSNVVRASDFLLIHGNGVSDPDKIAEMVRKTRGVPGYLKQPILFNEDDHFDFDQPKNNFIAALSEYASWGYFDPGRNNYHDGYQSPPVAWNINTERKRAFVGLLAEITGSRVEPASELSSKPKVTIRKGNYHGWADSYFLSNEKAEVVVVPAIGRVMQFGFLGEEGVFWENRALDGQAPNWNAKEWINFGGDKTWPAPEADWSKYTRRKEWRPPPAFDALPLEARVSQNDLVLTSPVDPYYGIRTERRVQLDPTQPVLTITTTYERVRGEPSNVSVWVITQLKEPEKIFVPRRSESRLTNGYTLLIPKAPPSLRVEKDWVSLNREPQAAHKIGADAGALLWVGPKHALLIESRHVSGAADYPDGGNSKEVYTNPDPLKYIELETLSPLVRLKPGEKTREQNVYKLLRRTSREPEQEAARLLH